MPALYDKPAVFQNFAVEDGDRLQKLPFYLVKNEVKTFPTWNVFEQLLDDINWEPNEGNIMKGVTPQRSPVGRSFFFPNAITTLPNKDIYQVTESTEQAIVYKHRYESYQFNFVPSFNSFWKNYLSFADKDIVEKIAISNNQFLETQMWFSAPNVYLAGAGVKTGCPTLVGNVTLDAAGSKTAGWTAATINGSGTSANPGVNQGLTLRDVYNAALALQEDFAAPPFESARNMPVDNEGLKGKYVLVTSTEAWMNFVFDPDVQTLKPLDLNLLFNDFRGLLFGTTTVKMNRYPIRMSLAPVMQGSTVLYPAGTPIPPEIYDMTDLKWKPNPYYTSIVSAPIEVAWMLGASFGKSIKVGPPPKEFSTRNMSAEKFYSLRWNAEVQLTDQVLIQYPDGTVDLNNYGEQLKFISQCTHGYLPGERRYGFPILFMRRRPSMVAA